MLVFVCLVVGIILYFMVLSPQAREARRFLKLMPVDQIQAVVLEPVPYNPTNLNRHTIRITDRQQISRIAGLLHSARRWSPNHPQQKWATYLCFELKDRAFCGELTSTSNQGVLFWYGLGPKDPGVVYGTYRQDALGPLIEGH
jgi:hypothetical protein